MLVNTVFDTFTYGSEGVKDAFRESIRKGGHIEPIGLSEPGQVRNLQTSGTYGRDRQAAPKGILDGQMEFYNW